MIVGEVTNLFMLFLVAIPEAGRKVKVIYNLTWAEEQEGLHETNLAGSILTLTRQLIPGVQLPCALVLQAKALETKPTKVPDRMEFSRKQLDPTLTKAMWLTIAKVEKGCNILSIMPILAFLSMMW